MPIVYLRGQEAPPLHCFLVYLEEGPLPGAAEHAGVSTVGGGTKDVLSCLRPYTTQMATWPVLTSHHRW